MISDTIKILAVDDAQQNLVALEALLRRPGLQVLCARSGADALELLLAHEIGLALVDIQMPDMDGFELAELMRGSPRSSHVPIIFLTASDRDARRTFRGYEVGAVDFLYKPFDAHALRSKVDVFVELAAHKLALKRQLDTVSQLLEVNETFSAALAHDLRNPLASISLAAEALRRVAPNEQVATLGRRMQGSAARMARMVAQLLEMVRLRSGRVVLMPRACDMAQLCTDVVAELQLVNPARLIRLGSSGDTAGVWDADALAQIFSNLVGNAVEHGDAGEPVDITVDGRDAARVSCSVRNGGVIPEALLPTLFAPYRSGEQAVRRDGLGLGLYIAQGLAERHGGFIDVRSNKDEGTVFCLRLPRHAGKAMQR